MFYAWKNIFLLLELRKQDSSNLFYTVFYLLFCLII